MSTDWFAPVELTGPTLTLRPLTVRRAMPARSSYMRASIASPARTPRSASTASAAMKPDLAAPSIVHGMWVRVQSPASVRPATG